MGWSTVLVGVRLRRLRCRCRCHPCSRVMKKLSTSKLEEKSLRQVATNLGQGLIFSLLLKLGVCQVLHLACMQAVLEPSLVMLTRAYWLARPSPGGPLHATSKMDNLVSVASTACRLCLLCHRLWPLTMRLAVAAHHHHPHPAADAVAHAGVMGNGCACGILGSLLRGRARSASVMPIAVRYPAHVAALSPCRCLRRLQGQSPRQLKMMHPSVKDSMKAKAVSKSQSP